MNVSQGSVATRLRCDGIFNAIRYTITAESDGERILKIKSTLICGSYRQESIVFF